jgi:hypothetical protein
MGSQCTVGSVAALFRDRAEAAHALRELHEGGLGPDEVDVAQPSHLSSMRDLLPGAALGVCAGLAVGFFVLPAAGVVAGFGVLLAAAVAGAVAGGAVGALVMHREQHQRAVGADDPAQLPLGPGETLVVARSADRWTVRRVLERHHGLITWSEPA